MLFDDTYKTLEEPAEAIFRDKGSKFLAFAIPARSEDDFKEQLKNLRSGHPKANHHCWALRLTRDRSVYKLSDDGEPSGTAGRPILNALLSHDLTDLGVVVVRYFGGTLLGVPGLINAYKTAAADAIAAGKIVEKAVCAVFRITFEHELTNSVMSIIKEEQLKIRKQEFDLKCSLDVEIRQNLQNRVLENLKKSGIKESTYLGNG